MFPQKPAPLPHSGLHLFAQTLPSWLWANDEKVADRKMPKEQAIDHRYIQVNARNVTKWLIFDLDHENALIYEDSNLPTPNLIVRNPDSGHSHLFYAITPVSTSDRSRRHPIDYMNYVRSWMKKYLEADAAYSGGPLAKNPLHPYWHTTDLHNTVYSLGDLMEYIPKEEEEKNKKKDKAAAAKRRSAQIEDDGNSRHVTLFHHVRRFAYDNVHDFRANGGNPESFMDALISFAESRNDFEQPLPYSSIKATARSVSRWVWRKYTGASAKGSNGKRIQRGIMELQSTGYPMHYKQRLAALRTASIKRSATEQRIHKACEQLHRDNRLTSVSRSGIAKLSRITRQGIQRYRDLVEKLRHEFGRLNLDKYQFRFISSLCQSSSASGIGVDLLRGLHEAEGEETRRTDSAGKVMRDSGFRIVGGVMHGRGIWSKHGRKFWFFDRDNPGQGRESGTGHLMITHP